MERIPLVLLHGALGSKAMLDPLKHLLEEDYEVYSFDFPGHGGSMLFPERFDLADFAREIHSHLEDLHISKVNIFGYSMGGYVALWMAKLFPDSVNKIVTLGTKFDWTPESANHEIRFLDPQKVKAKVPAFAHALHERHEQHDWEKIMTQTAEMMQGLGNGKALQTIDFIQIHHPVKIMVGDQDNMVSAEESHRVASDLPFGVFKIMLNAPHPLEKVYLGNLKKEISEFL
ncbi:alpha/beta hydrolase [Cytophagales bacterium LB-30]|uniref:Alpha/beta hydrolase n=1 Tax=Shiella aurantiaca TaxID=3058365 RepID=A0ABT8F8K2_9BACT|nr:alpha/beta hydrolase [Shiella aurantiaca]MDN4166810.1 alpha/beta hydrolase [Shiella aurantiaca]